MSRPRIGFLGTGWIGRHRMNAMLTTGLIDPVAIVDGSEEAAAEAIALAPGARRVGSLDAMLKLGVDGVVIATPSALHADQAVRALNAGAAVFCQKPLGRNAAEVESILSAARVADRLLDVDLSYRQTAAMQRIRPLVQSGALGTIRAIDLTFHNAYGPDKPWFYDAALSGGGCVMDLGVHMIDLALWCLGFPAIDQVEATLFSPDGTLDHAAGGVEDLAFATLTLANGTLVRLACSWRLQAGRDAIIEASFYGSEGGAALRNVGGSFYDFEALRFAGTASETLVGPPDAWGGRAAADWATRLSRSPRYDPAAERLLCVSKALDRIYAAAQTIWRSKSANA
jgi:predicted dehydrogenase